MKEDIRQKYIRNQKNYFLENNDSSIMYYKYSAILNKIIKLS